MPYPFNIYCCGHPENSYLVIEFDVGFQRNVMGHYMYKLKDNFEDIIRDETSHAALTNVNIKIVSVTM